MDENSLEKGWNWKKAQNIEKWQQPDGAVMSLALHLGQDTAKKVYDLGCGMGRHTLFFASQGYEVHASDITEDAVVTTQTALKKSGLQAVVKQSKMTAIDYPNDYFDLLIAYHVIYHGYKNVVEQTIKEISRVLKPNGLFYGTFLAANPHNKKRHYISKKVFIADEEPEKGVPHYVCDEKDVLNFLKSFRIIKLELLEDIIPERSFHFRFLAEKK